MRVLVIGATGFVGSHVVRALLAAGHEVTGFRRSTSSLELLRGIELGWHEGSLEDEASLRAAIRGKDAVVHAAGTLSLWPRAEDELWRTNVLGTRNVARACLDAGARLIWDGSAGIYAGAPRLEPADERGNASRDRYASFHVVSMALAEAEVLRAVAAGLDGVLLHPTLVVGAGDRGFHSSWLLLAHRKSWLALCPVGGLNLVAVGDVAHAHVLALEKAKRGSIYLLGGENLTNAAVTDLVQETLDRKRPVLQVPRAPFRALGALAHVVGVLRGRDKLGRMDLNSALAHAATLYWFVDCAKAERELGWKASPVKPALAAQRDWLHERGVLDGG